MLHDEGGHRKVDEFLSWLRGVLQQFSGRSLVLMVSGSIGLTPLVRRLGIPDRINYLNSFRLRPWSKEASIKCFNRLITTSKVQFESGVAEAVYERLGIGVPHHIQSFFAKLTDHARMLNQDQVSVSDVDKVYQNELLGPAGQIDLIHYETRLKDGIGDDQDHTLAMEILTEAATKDLFTPDSQRQLARLYSPIIDETSDRISGVLEILEHDGYLEVSDIGHQFSSRLLKDWWAARFGHRFVPIEQRGPVRNE